MQTPMPLTWARQMTETSKAGPKIVLLPSEEKEGTYSSRNSWEKDSRAQGLGWRLLNPYVSWVMVGKSVSFSVLCFPLL